MTRKELPARAANIQRAVASTTTCTSATVESLRSFLLPTSPAVVQTKTSAVKAPALKAKASSVRSTGAPGVKTRKKPVDVPEEAEAQAQNRDRVALATEVVNTTLKALSEAIRTPLVQKRRVPLRRTSSTTSFTNGYESRSQTPLQPLSVNCVTSTSDEKGHLRRSSSMISIDGRLSGLRAQAECTRTAFAALRSIQGQKWSPPIPYLQLESGMSALIGRLITLGFCDLAVKEIRILKKRLEAAVGPPDRQKASRHAVPIDRQIVTEAKTETLVDMLRFDELDIQGPLLALVITTQLQTLKILALQQDASVIESALQHLRLEVAHSPSNMIQRQINLESPATRDKAAYQLECLAQALIGLCPSQSIAEDHRIPASSLRLSPSAAFELHSLAFQIRSLWWKIAHHRTDLVREMINPFARCLATFHRRSKMERQENYATALSACERITCYFKVSTGFKESMMLAIYNALADMAQESFQYPEAIRWIRKARKSTMDSEASQTRICILDCRLASLLIRTLDSGSSDHLVQILRAASSSLAGDLQGESAELDELVITLASLRRSAFSIIQEHHKPRKTDDVRLQPMILDACSEFMLLYVKFLLRYIGNGPNRREEQKSTVRRDQRRRLAVQVAYPAIDAVAVMANLSVRGTLAEWSRLDLGLRDSVALALVLRGSGNEALDGAERTPCPFLSLSNAYWYRYLHLKQTEADPGSLRDCLRISIDIVQNSSPSQRASFRLPSKLEKYARLCEDLRDNKEAAETYGKAVHIHITNGLLSKAAEAASVRSMPHALEHDAELAPFAQHLVAYVKAAVKAVNRGRSVDTFLDDLKLCPSERCILLEQQLIAILDAIQDHGSTPAVSKALITLVQAVFSLYTEQAYPVRRLRVIVRLLSGFSTNLDALDEIVRDELLRKPSPVSKEPHSDMGLLAFFPHLTLCWNILIDIFRGAPNVEMIEAVMASFVKLLHDYPDWSALQLQVYDISDWLSQLELLAKFLDMQGLGLTRISVLHVLVLIHEASTSMQCPTLVSKLSTLGLQYSRLGYSGAASIALRKAERYVEVPDVSVKIALQYHLVRAEIAHAVGDSESCSDNLDKAQVLFQDVKRGENQRTRCTDQSDRSLLVGDAAYLLSKLAATEGSFAKALHYARLCVKSYQKSWSIMERGKPSNQLTASAATNDIESIAPLDALSELSISECKTIDTVREPQTLPPLFGAAFWSIVPRLSKGYTHLSSLFSHHGLLPEVRFYLGQAQKIANTVRASALIGQHSALLGQYTIRGGELDEGLRLLQQADSLLFNLPRGHDYAFLQLFFAGHSARQRQWQAGYSSLDAVEATLEKLTKKAFVDALVHKQATLEDLDLQLSTLSLREIKKSAKPKVNAKNITSSKRPVVPEANNGKKNDLPSAKAVPTVEVMPIQYIRGEVKRERASIALCEGDLKAAGLLLTEASTYPCDQRGIISQALLSSRIRYCEKLEQLVVDPVYCVIPESTISHPSIRVCSGLQQAQKTSHAPLKIENAVPSRIQRGKAPTNKRRPRSPSLRKVEPDVLNLAQDELTKVFKLARKLASTGTLHEISDMLGRILLLLSTTSSSDVKSSVSPTFVVYTLEVGRILSMTRESAAIRVEQQVSLTKYNQHWPGGYAVDDCDTVERFAALDFGTFQDEYIDIIPSNWTAISLTLTESREDLMICKIRAGQAPFVLKLPLTRHNSFESDEESFGFDQGRAELQEIVLSANKSTHGAENLSRKGAKTEWWEARTALDARLKDLLNDIESIWFGGFKSLFSHNDQDPSLLARFQQSLQNILDKHLPSRQKSGRVPQTSRVTLDQNVLELFIGLGNPSESNDVDASLTDLLYFVVDIMQFHGERNAYDEVDFDAIAIETIDALRHYHQAIEDDPRSNEGQHTILILDKHLHCFPWESLPCLSGQAVTRLSSLDCLKNRILQQKKVNKDKRSSLGTSRVSVDRNDGVSILNPAGDLKATQSRFEEPLQGLPGWQTIVQIEPTESEMTGYLGDHEIFLYFGHGSGAQYIRSRTIKKLEKCAVALLMGCSSGALTEAGEFEPYGTPMNYMHAGSPAMLATLWDVTDKDIDKFSSTVLEKWGLFGKAKAPVPSSPVKKSAKQRGKSKVEAVEEIRAVEAPSVSLDEAVAQGRNSCLLRYLNGAAPVVYGVPVFLSD